jgi:hypothetical protein
MKKTESWFKPYILNPHNIEKIVAPGKPGVYVLGNMEEGKKVKVKHIHMSENIKEDLKKNLGKFHVFMYKPINHYLPSSRVVQQTFQFTV